jgi:hypothetical protein
MFISKHTRTKMPTVSIQGSTTKGPCKSGSNLVSAGSSHSNDTGNLVNHYDIGNLAELEVSYFKVQGASSQ